MYTVSTIISLILLAATSHAMEIKAKDNFEFYDDEDGFCIIEQKKPPLPQAKRPILARSYDARAVLTMCKQKTIRSAALLKLVSSAREETWQKLIIMSATPQEFVIDFKKTLEANAKNISLDPKSYYDALGIDRQVGKQKTHIQIMKHIQHLHTESEHKKYENEPTQEQEQRLLRQVIYPFKTSLGKQCYDAFLDKQLESFVEAYQFEHKNSGDLQELFTMLAIKQAKLQEKLRTKK